LWRERGRKQLEPFRLTLGASRRQRDLLELPNRPKSTTAELSQPIEQELDKCPKAQRLMMLPEVAG
jgi:hypothetical protein